MRTDNHTIMKGIKLYIGLDVHKDSITTAVAEPDPKGEIRLFGTITNDLHALEKALSRIRKAHPGAQLEVAYEAGPCGFGIARRFQQLGVPCLVAAPSLIPRQPGAPFKTDKRAITCLCKQATTRSAFLRCAARFGLDGGSLRRVRLAPESSSRRKVKPNNQRSAQTA